jgi:tRNA nucleotidyltransferase (CCA-adding enzyme)
MSAPRAGTGPEAGLDAYVVGGAVRDALLGLPVNDRDWVVVGSTPERMAELGFRPVGRDFPVFLHPVTQEEYALARTERKTGRGYRGFVVQCSPDVTLEDDLRRRDLTINAMARAPGGTLVDPWGGERDLRDRVLRHVSDAFAEDPVRILRLARFAARFADFSIAPETAARVRTMVAAGEVDALVPERVWQELARGLGERAPSRMFEVLHAHGALARLLPELDAHWGPRLARAVDAAAAAGAPLAVRFAALLHPLDPSAVEPACGRVRAPNDARDLARLASAEHAANAASDTLDAAGVLALLERCDAIRKPARFEALLAACHAVARAGDGSAGSDGASRAEAAPAGEVAPSAKPTTADGAPIGTTPPAWASRLSRALAAARAVDAGAIAAEVARTPDAGPVPERIGAAVHAARERAVSDAIGPTPGSRGATAT